MAEHGDEITLDILGKMEVLHNMMNEALRLHPPLIMLLRYVKVPFTVTTTTGVTYDIPKVRNSGPCNTVTGTDGIPSIAAISYLIGWAFPLEESLSH